MVLGAETIDWWKTAVFYQIYPRSFADGNGDGIGDIRGIIEKLDYLRRLGVDAIWLSPHYPSPNHDCGYDISDYTAVAPEYGSLEDFREFLDRAHRLGIRVITDLVLNHSSDEHPWFLESSSSRDNPKADWYVWSDEMPNDWQSCFDGPAWTWSEARGQYYYHYFMRQQPDLNWKNPAVKAAMWEAARFWLDLGVDGFRLDAVGTIFEDPSLRSHRTGHTLASLRRQSELAATPAQKRRVGRLWRRMFARQVMGPGTHELMKELRAVLDQYPGDRVLVGEDDDIAFMGDGEDELDLVFNFPLMRPDGPLGKARVIRNQRQRLSRIARLPKGGWPCNTFGNHDSSRAKSHYAAPGEEARAPGSDDRRARLAAALAFTLRGTPFLYNGEEIGMSDFPIPDPIALRDTMAAWYYRAMIDELKVAPEEAAKRAAAMSRDRCRTPMQWAVGPNAGFCPPDVRPWLPVNPDASSGVNVADEERDPDSMLSFYRRLAAARRSSPALVLGDWKPIRAGGPNCLAYLRRVDGDAEQPGQVVLVLLNFSAKEIEIDLSRALGRRAPKARSIFLENAPEPGGLDRLRLGGWGILVAELARWVS